MASRARLTLFVVSATAAAALVASLAVTADPTDPSPKAAPAAAQRDQVVSTAPADCPTGTVTLDPGVCQTPDPKSPELEATHEHGGALSSEFAAGYTYGAPTKTPAVNVPCTKPGTTGNRIQAVYAYFGSARNRAGTVKPVLTDALLRANGIVYYSAKQTKDTRHLRYATDSRCKPSIATVHLPASAASSMSATVSALRKVGYTSASRKYIVFADTRRICGQGQVYYDDQPGPANRNNRGDTIARVDLGCWTGTAVAHEVVHMLGAVQPSAARDSGGLHCRDEWDLMCYNDGHARVYVDRKCATRALDERLDCNKNDYFNTRPARGSYLAVKWNVARNSFLWGGSAAYTPPPSSVRTVKVVGYGATGAKITFAAPAVDTYHGAATSYEIKRDSTVLTRQGATTYVDTKALPGRSTYWVTATNGSGRGPSVGVTVTLAEKKPSAPTNLSASVSAQSVKVTWSMPTRTYLAGAVTSVSVRRNGQVAMSGGAFTTTFLDSYPVDGVNTYEVTVSNSAGSSTASTKVTVALPPTPGAPTHLTATPGKAGVTLTWTAPAVTPTAGAARDYIVVRNRIVVGIVTQPSFVDTTVPNGPATYWVAPRNLGGTGTISPVVNVTVAR